MWEVKNYLSTRKTGKVDCEEFINWSPGDRVDAFPSWCPVDEWAAGGHIVKMADEKVSPARGGTKSVEASQGTAPSDLPHESDSEGSSVDTGLL